jgi:RTX calcium-binding nonapeptide repeat (4 copies)
LNSYHTKSAIIGSIASILIASMLLGSVLISNVYAKGSGAEKSKYNLEESCKDDVKGKQITLTGSRSTDNTDTRTDTDAKVDKDAQRLINDSGTLGRVDTDFDAFGKSIGIDKPDGTLGIFKNNGHIEAGRSIDFIDPVTGEHRVLPLNSKVEAKQKETEDFKKSLPLKERRVFNVCGLPIGNIVDGFQFNEVDGTKKSDILLGTSAADDMSGKDGGDVIQARDDDDIVHAGKGDDSVQGGFGNDNIHADDGDDAVFAGPNDDYLNGGKGNDELYAQDGDDTLEGGPGADFFDCGTGFDVVVDFNPSEGDVTNDNCEDVRTVL